jgi:hypothetical protein
MWGNKKGSNRAVIDFLLFGLISLRSTCEIMQLPARIKKNIILIINPDDDGINMTAMGGVMYSQE